MLILTYGTQIEIKAMSAAVSSLAGTVTYVLPTRQSDHNQHCRPQPTQQTPRLVDIFSDFKSRLVRTNLR